mgnify:CR=1 FL=1
MFAFSLKDYFGFDGCTFPFLFQMIVAKARKTRMTPCGLINVKNEVKQSRMVVTYDILFGVFTNC